jgi:hypothetical protein
MADFDSTTQALQSVNRAANLLPAVRSVYSQAKAVQELLNLYQANTDATFNATINALFTSAQRTELANMLGDVNTLLADWEANHRSALGLP